MEQATYRAEGMEDSNGGSAGQSTGESRPTGREPFEGASPRDKLVLAVERLAERGVQKAGRGRAWGAEEDEALLEFVRAQGMGNLSAALEEAAHILQRTPVAVRARYYRLCVQPEGAAKAGRKKRRADSRSRGQRKAAFRRDAAEDEILESMGGFLNVVSKLDIDLDGLLRGLWRISELALQGKQAPDLKAQIARLEEDNAELRMTVESASRRLDELRSQYELLDYLVNEFINLNSVDKVTSLGDFGRRLRYQVDQFGTVVKVERF